MFRGLYTAAWGMHGRDKSMEVITNNIANASTNGYKKDGIVFQSFSDVLAKRINDTHSPSSPTSKVGAMTMGSDIGEIFTNYTQGQLSRTDNKLDASIDGADGAFFTVGVVDPNGDTKEYHTKDGAFAINANGYLVTKSGGFIQGEKGPIKIKTEDFSISDDGTISVDNKKVDKLKIVQFESTRALQKYGENLITADPEEPKKSFTGTVKQGFIETSNVNSVREMVDMMTLMRSYETNQKIIQTIDETIGKTVNEVGTVR